MPAASWLMNLGFAGSGAIAPAIGPKLIATDIYFGPAYLSQSIQFRPTYRATQLKFGPAFDTDGINIS